MKKLHLSRFTLLEMLTVITTFCLLLGLVLPALCSGSSRAKQIACAGNLRSIGQCVTLYCNDNSGNIPNLASGMENNSIPILRLPGNMVVALGRLVDSYTTNALIFGCPDSPMYTMEDVEQSWQNTPMVWSAYLYRAGNSGFSSRLYAPENFHKAYIMDFACITNQGEQFAPHNYSSSNLLFTDCHVENRVNSREPFRFYTAQAARHGEMLPDCSRLWQNADE